MKIAIIGAGMSGANIYHLLKKDGNNVTIFDKARGAGGRCSTRYVGERKIDHGTPSFELSSSNFRHFCDEQCEQNILIKKENVYYPVDGLNKMCSSLILNKDFKRNIRIASCKYKDELWTLIDENDKIHSGYHKLIISIPTTQLLQLDMPLSKSIKHKLQSVTYDSVASLMLYNEKNNTLNDKLFSYAEFQKVIDNSSKYNYKDFSSYVLHLKRDVSQKQNFKNKSEVQTYILGKVNQMFGVNLEKDFHIVPHLWKYAFVSNCLKESYIYDEQISLGLCGDYFMGENLQSAYLSSLKLYHEKFRN